MNKRILSIIGLVILGVLLFWAGTVYGQSRWTPWGAGDWYNMMGSGMMGNRDRFQQPFGPGMMGGNGMMGSGMMRGMGMHGGMGNWWNSTGAEPLSIEEAETAVSDYLAALDQDNLSLGEVMIFSNHAYAQIVNENTGIGAFEVLVDPVAGNVLPEPGPNMMWNTEYGHMGGFGGGMMGGMMGSWSNAPEAENGVTAEEAIQIAQRYLDANLPGATADETADAFPGYYTLHVLQDGEITGMLSVNAITGQVFPHHWHGDFVEMAGDDH
jgi:hypothetical protein